MAAKEVVVSAIVKKLETERKRRVLAANAEGSYPNTSDEDLFVSSPSIFTPREVPIQTPPVVAAAVPTPAVSSVLPAPATTAVKTSSSNSSTPIPAAVFSRERDVSFDRSSYNDDDEEDTLGSDPGRSRLSNAISEAAAARRRLRKASVETTNSRLSQGFTPDRTAPPVPVLFSGGTGGASASSKISTPASSAPQTPVFSQRQQLDALANNLDKQISGQMQTAVRQTQPAGAKQRLDDIMNSLCLDLDEAISSQGGIAPTDTSVKPALGTKKVATRKKSSAADGPSYNTHTPTSNNPINPSSRPGSAAMARIRGLEKSSAASSLSEIDRLAHQRSGSSGRLNHSGSGTIVNNNSYTIRPIAGRSDESLGSDEIPKTVFKTDSGASQNGSLDILKHYGPSAEDLCYEDGGGRKEIKETSQASVEVKKRPQSTLTGQAYENSVPPTSAAPVIPSVSLRNPMSAANRATRGISLHASGLDMNNLPHKEFEVVAKGMNEHGYLYRDPMLEKVGKVNGTQYNFFLSRAELYCANSKDSSIFANFPIPLSHILNVAWENKKVVIIWIYKNAKSEPRIIDLDVEFSDLFTNSQWALKLQSISCKGNPAEVSDKQAIFFVDQDDVKGVREILQTLIIPVLEAARKPFDIQLIEPDFERLNHAIERLDITRVNSITYLRLKSASTKTFKIIDECLYSGAMRAKGRDASRVKVLQPEMDPVEVALAVIKEPLQFSQFCVMNTIVRPEKGRIVKNKQRHR
ncbi:hypothetical protein BJ741DRAFT_239324 [Chytriomyces cf. hyalinus JEL632]|nr:hypothetical protein BJ741DRAFT_239324 [Chytriomyces cf. hyalinus JEL632]